MKKFYDRMKDILLFKTIDGEYKTLEEYPKAEGNKIYYVTDENLQAQYISMFKENWTDRCGTDPCDRSSLHQPAGIQESRRDEIPAH